jgi:hypothetical protein
MDGDAGEEVGMAGQRRKGGWSRNKRARRFWTAHGRTTTHLRVLHALSTNPTATWTPEGISTWYRIPLNAVRDTLEELAAAGIAVPTEQPWRGFRWNRLHDWATPDSNPIRGIVLERLLVINARVEVSGW